MMCWAACRALYVTRGTVIVQCKQADVAALAGILAAHDIRRSQASTLSHAAACAEKQSSENGADGGGIERGQACAHATTSAPSRTSAGRVARRAAPAGPSLPGAPLSNAPSELSETDSEEPGDGSMSGDDVEDDDDSDEEDSDDEHDPKHAGQQQSVRHPGMQS